MTDRNTKKIQARSQFFNLANNKHHIIHPQTFLIYSNDIYPIGNPIVHSNATAMMARGKKNAKELSASLLSSGEWALVIDSESNISFRNLSSFQKGNCRPLYFSHHTRECRRKQTGIGEHGKAAITKQSASDITMDGPPWYNPTLPRRTWPSKTRQKGDKRYQCCPLKSGAEIELALNAWSHISLYDIKISASDITSGKRPCSATLYFYHWADRQTDLHLCKLHPFP